MTTDMVLSIFQEVLSLVFLLAGPLLIISIIIGLIISILQAATQVHEQTLTFVPKLVAIGVLLFILGPWMINLLNDFIYRLFDIMADIV